MQASREVYSVCRYASFDDRISKAGTTLGMSMLSWAAHSQEISMCRVAVCCIIDSAHGAANVRMHSHTIIKGEKWIDKNEAENISFVISQVESGR